MPLARAARPAGASIFFKPLKVTLRMKVAVKEEAAAVALRLIALNTPLLSKWLKKKMPTKPIQAAAAAAAAQKAKAWEAAAVLVVLPACATYELGL